MRSIKIESERYIMVFMTDIRDQNIGLPDLADLRLKVSKSGDELSDVECVWRDMRYGYYRITLYRKLTDKLGDLAIYVYDPEGRSVPYHEVIDVVAYDPQSVDNLGLSYIDTPISTRSNHSASSIWSVTSRALTDKSNFSLSLDYDAAKTAASQASVDSIKAETDDIPTILSGLSNIEDIVTIIRNVELGRWKLDKTAKQWILYEDDGVTELKRFNLFDDAGNPSADAVYERVPV